jgi:hypothetical protein
MKIIITERQFRLILEDKSSKEKMKELIQEFGLKHVFENFGEDIVIKKLGSSFDDVFTNEVKKICDELLGGLYKDVEIKGGTIYILMEGEKTYFYDDYLSKIREQLPWRYNNAQFKFEKEFSANVEYDEDGDEYDVTLMKSLDDGSFFELTGRLSQYSSGRADEWEFEPDYISDDDYYTEMWEVIDEYIVDGLTDKIYNEKRKITEGKETLEDDFDEKMKPYSNITSSVREFWDEDTNETYDRENYYLDIDEDWENDWFVFSLGEPNDNNEYNLLYNNIELKDVKIFFPKKTFDKLLKNWFQKTYGNKIYKVIPYGEV